MIMKEGTSENRKEYEGREQERKEKKEEREEILMIPSKSQSLISTLLRFEN